MNKCKISIFSKENTEKKSTDWDYDNILVFNEEYEIGDYILVKVEDTNSFLEMQLDETMLPSISYFKENEFKFIIPFEADKRPYSPKSFSGSLHLLTAKFPTDDDIYKRRNLVFNPYDIPTNNAIFPHASANIETRGESVFFARNVIDGVFANESHGNYPYHSWGINRDPKAQLRIDLENECIVDEVRLTLRADFPHDSYWIKGTLTFSDGSKEIVDLIKSDKPQCFKFEKRKISYLTLDELIQADDPSPFPALTQIEVFGEIIK